MRYALTEEDFGRIFGAPREARGVGRARKCHTCGGWHAADKPWPHNCRKPAPPRNRDLAAPDIAGPFEPFVPIADPSHGPINDRREKRDFMARRGLAEHAPGIGRRNTWVEDYDLARSVEESMRQVMQMDPLAMPPEYRGERLNEGGGLDDGTEIDVSAVEVNP